MPYKKIRGDKSTCNKRCHTERKSNVNTIVGILNVSDDSEETQGNIQLLQAAVNSHCPSHTSHNNEI